MAWELLQGDCLEVLKTLPEESVHTCVTSPPYWGLRDYGVDGQLGLEQTPEEYVAKMVEVFREVKRVLKKDGTLWLNMGDCYMSNPNCDIGDPKNMAGRKKMDNPNRHKIVGLKPKDLVGIPWRLAFALQGDGWYLRSDIIWAKSNPMPESVTDRPTKAHEYIFLMAKSERYYYDAEAIKEESTSKPTDKVNVPGGWDIEKGTHGTIHRENRTVGQYTQRTDKQRGHSRRHAGFNERWDRMTKEEQCSMRRNKRTVWTVATHPFPEAHFATFPPKLIVPCILAGCPEGGTVLDPFVGSGTTLFVSEQLGRNSIGIELNPDYCKIIERRMNSIHPNLFEGATYD